MAKVLFHAERAPLTDEQRDAKRRELLRLRNRYRTALRLASLGISIAELERELER